MTHRTHRVLATLPVLSCLWFPIFAPAQTYPSKPIRVFVTVPAGGAADQKLLHTAALSDATVAARRRKPR